MDDYSTYYAIQKTYKEKVIRQNQLPATVQYIAGADVAYDDRTQRMIGAIVVLDADSLDVVDESAHEMEITFPYVPGLFSFREIPSLIQAFEQLKIRPDLLICDGHGIAHPRGVGMATHLGIELDIPTIGCAKKRLTGAYDKATLGNERGDWLPLELDGATIGAALRTRKDVKPMFVSIGHKVDLDTAMDWVLKACTEYRLPETTRAADGLVNRLITNY